MTDQVHDECKVASGIRIQIASVIGVDIIGAMSDRGSKLFNLSLKLDFYPTQINKLITIANIQYVNLL